MLRREQIKDRMLKTAARIWEVPESEIDSNFDPLVSLMLEACAAEFEQLEYSLHSTQDRLLDRLAEHVLPEAMINATPASCIVKTSPLDPVASINERIAFNITQRIQQVGLAAYNKEFFFTPIGKVNLINAEVRYIKIADNYYKCGVNGVKEPLINGDANGYTNEMWLALHLDPKVTSLKGLQLYFDLKGHSEANNFYDSLQHAKLYYQNMPITVSPGYSNKNQFELNLEDTLQNGLSYTRKIQKKIAGIYQSRFVSIADHFDIGKNDLPTEWSDMPEKQSQEIKESNTVFLKVQLSRLFHIETLDRLLCVTNAFPAINRQQNTVNHKTDALVNIVPIAASNSFLDLDEITSNAGNPYTINISANAQQLSEGEAMVRSSGIGKTSSNDLRQMITNLTEAIRDESAYFSRINNDFVTARLKEITRILARLEDQVSLSKNKKEALNYLLIKPKTSGESITVKYWATNGEDAHFVKSGSILTPHNHSLVSGKSTLTMTNAVGGKSSTSNTERKLLLRQQLSSSGKIISAEDVKLLCFQLFGNKLKNVNVKKNIGIGNSVREGFQRSIDIELLLNNEITDTAKDEVDYLCSELKYLLVQNASPIYPFNIKLVSAIPK